MTGADIMLSVLFCKTGYEEIRTALANYRNLYSLQKCKRQKKKPTQQQRIHWVKGMELYHSVRLKLY